ncbi:MAG TPA: alkaline phosphatase family protein [Bryobacteraceae bacterium]|nr:alkaline phosphatase family protein [Bryobacteraceae bacterium]
MRLLGMVVVVVVCTSVQAADYSAPARLRPAIRRPGSPSILPGGRIIAPAGHQYVTGPGPFGLAISPDSKTIVSVNSGPERFSLTVLESNKKGGMTTRHLVAAPPRGDSDEHREVETDQWRTVFMGAAFTGNHSAYVSEGNTGRVRLVDLSTGNRRKVYDLNHDGFSDSYTGDLAFDAERSLLYVLDQANFRLVIIDTRKGRIAASLPVGRLPFAIALSPDRRTAYITNVGMFRYNPIPGADRKNAPSTGLPFPAFGFPSTEASDGARRETARGTVDVPGLGDPNARESNSLYIVSVEDPAAPRVEAFIRTGKAFGAGADGGSSPCGVIATADRVFVSNTHNDTVTSVDPRTRAIVGEAAIRIPGLESFRGVMPVGMAFDAPHGWLLVAEAGINAVGVVDIRDMRVLGHIPVAWFPTRVLLEHDTVYVTNAKGHGTGPNIYRSGGSSDNFVDVLRRGSISVFPIPDAASLGASTAIVMEANGFRPRATPAPPVPPEIRHVVLIVKENRTFDEVLGDMAQSDNGPVAGVPALARFGMRGFAEGRKSHFSLQDVPVTPNHHSLAKRWMFSDNFYADSEVSVDGHHWLVDAYPDVWTESSRMASYAGGKDFRFPTTAPGRLLFAESNSSVHPEEQPEGGTIWHHLERHGIPFRNFGEGFELAGNEEEPGEKPTGARFLTNVPMPAPLYRNTSREYPGFNTNIPDQYRADQFIHEIRERYEKGGEEFPRLIFIHLPNDHMAKVRPEDGYPFQASYVADNDFALGRIVEFLSNSPWWKDMAVFITEDDAQGGRDHIDSHRTVLIGAGPYFKRNYVSHVHSSFPGMLKTIFRILGVPPLNLYDATASDLADSFTNSPDFTPYQALPEDERLFDPANAREPAVPTPSPRMDDPAAIRELEKARTP